eukprot:4619916-Amphidinium_carterae.1
MESATDRIREFGRASGQRCVVSSYEWKEHIAASKAVRASACATVGLEYEGSLLVQVTLDTTPVSVRMSHAVSV